MGLRYLRQQNPSNTSWPLSNSLGLFSEGPPRDRNILKLLRATPLRPQTILTAHVFVKLTLTVATLALLVLAGKCYYPVGVHAPLLLVFALLISTRAFCRSAF